MEKVERKKCPVCSKEINIFERLGKKFCSPKCRNMFHNRTKAEEREKRKDISDNLKTNYQILKKYLNRTANFSDLKFLGYNENYFTHLHTDRNGKVIANAIWDLAIQRLNEKQVKVVKI